MAWKELLIIFMTGVFILVGAIIINSLAKTIGLTTWYDLLINLKNNGIKELSNTNFLSLIFLFVIYPLVLGTIGYFSLNSLVNLIK